MTNSRALIAKIIRTGKLCKFDQIDIGSPFFYLNRLWVRTDYSAGTELQSSNVTKETGVHISTCSFIEDGVWVEVEKVKINFEREFRNNDHQTPSDDTRLIDSELSERVKHALRDEGFKTVGDLKNLSTFRFMMIPNIGKKSLDDLESFLNRSLTDARFPEKDENYSDRLIRRRKWLAEN